jgi:hypothetical protein
MSATRHEDRDMRDVGYRLQSGDHTTRCHCAPRPMFQGTSQRASKQCRGPNPGGGDSALVAERCGAPGQGQSWLSTETRTARKGLGGLGTRAGSMLLHKSCLGASTRVCACSRNQQDPTKPCNQALQSSLAGTNRTQRPCHAMKCMQAWAKGKHHGINNESYVTGGSTRGSASIFTLQHPRHSLRRAAATAQHVCAAAETQSCRGR